MSPATHPQESVEPIKRDVTDPLRLAKAVLKKHYSDATFPNTPLLRYFQGQFWRYYEGAYRVVHKDLLYSQIDAVAQEESDREATANQKEADSVTDHVVNNVIDKLRALRFVDAEKMPVWLGDEENRIDHALCCTDGLFVLGDSIEEARVIPHTPEWFNSVRLPYEGNFETFDADDVPFAYDPEGRPAECLRECPKWETFLEEIFEGDQERIALAQELFGYSLVADTSYQKFFLLFGRGSNGKSVFINVLTSLVGEENCSNIPLEILFDRFQAARTNGKLLNLVSETESNSRKKLSTGQLKAFVAGDRIYSDRKGIDGVEFRPTARIVVASNKLPSVEDDSHGFWRRAIVIPFNVTISKEKQNRHLIDDLLEELPGVFHWALLGLYRLREQDGFTHSKACEDALEQYRNQVDPASAYLQERFVAADESEKVTCDAVRDGYREYVDDEFATLDITKIQAVFPKVQRKQKRVCGIPQWHYVGLQPKTKETVM